MTGSLLPMWKSFGSGWDENAPAMWLNIHVVFSSLSFHNPISSMSQFPDSNPYESPHSYSSDPMMGGHDPHGRALAQSKVNLPAIFLIILAPIGILFFGFDLFGRTMFDQADNPFLQNMDEPGAAEGAMVGNVIGGALDIIGAILQLVVIFGAIQMRALKSRSLAMAAAIISCIPCLSACCVLGIPFGIWSLVVLNDPAVKQAFES